MDHWEKLPAIAQIAAQFVFEILLPAPFVVLVTLFTGAQWSLAGFMATYPSVCSRASGQPPAQDSPVPQG